MGTNLNEILREKKHLKVIFRKSYWILCNTTNCALKKAFSVSLRYSAMILSLNS